MVGWMECRKTLKLGIIFYMQKIIMKAKRNIYIQEKDENNLGIYLLANKIYIFTFYGKQDKN
jgi:hypothetical protein